MPRRRCSHSGGAPGATDREAAAGAGQRLRRGVLGVPGLRPAPRHHALRAHLLPALHRPGHQHAAGTGAALAGLSWSQSWLKSCACALDVCCQEQARCPLCRHEIKTNELVEFQPEEEEEGRAASSQNWAASSMVGGNVDVSR